MGLEDQLAMNRQTWQALQDHGVTEQTKLRLDFFYVAPSEREAEGLKAFLERETDYDVAASLADRGLLQESVWSFNGTTRRTELSSAILDEWVTWMVAAGEAHGCEFDGWGAQVP